MTGTCPAGNVTLVSSFVDGVDTVSLEDIMDTALLQDVSDVEHRQYLKSNFNLIF